jgi:hypothetical protein
MAARDQILSLFRFVGSSSNDIEMVPGASLTTPKITVATDDETGLLTVDSISCTGLGAFNATVLGLLELENNTLRMDQQRTIATAATTGVKGDWCHDANFIYICTATNTWKRVAIATW